MDHARFTPRSQGCDRSFVGLTRFMGSSCSIGRRNEAIMVDSSSEKRYFSLNTDVRGHSRSFLILRSFPRRVINVVRECVESADLARRRIRYYALILEKGVWATRRAIQLSERDDRRLSSSEKRWQGRISNRLPLAIRISDGL